MKRIGNIIIVCAIVIALLIPTTITAFAAETDLVITSSDYKTLCMTAGEKVVFCADRTATTPHAGVSYTKTETVSVNGLEEVAINNTVLDDGTIEFNTATQYAVWQCLEPEIDMVRMATIRHNSTVGEKVEEILTTSAPENFLAEISFYEADGYQTICTWEVIETFGGYNPPTETEAPTETPTTVPETEAPETEVPTETPTTVVPETEVPETTAVPETEAPETTVVPETTIPEVEEPVTDATSATGDNLLGTVDVPNTGVSTTTPIVFAVIGLAIIATIILVACKKKAD